MPRSARSTASALRLLVTLAAVAALIVLLASLLAAAVSAAPRDDVVGVDDDIVVLDESTETPVVEPESELTPVAIPSVSPVPTRDPFDITSDIVEEFEQVPSSGDMLIASETCDPIVPGLIDDRFCGPAASSGYNAYLYAGTSNQNYTVAYQGALPVDLLDLPAGPYMLSVGPTPVLMQHKMVCRLESDAGGLIQTLTGTTFIQLSLGSDTVARCTVYLLPEGQLPDEIQTADGPAELVITDIWCPPGTDPALNFFGLIGRCGQRATAKDWEARTATGGYAYGEVIDDGVARLDLYGDIWSVTNSYPSSFYAPTLYCNVRDELGNEPPAYAPFMTYEYGPSGAVIPLEQHLTWNCVSYTIPMDTGTGADVAQVTSTVHACPEGTTSPTIAACAQTLPGVTVHLLYGAQTIVATKQTDAAGGVAFAAPENLSVFGLAEEVPAGYRLAPIASCSVNGGAPADYAVDQYGIVDLGALIGGDTVACDWFNILDSGAPAVPALDLEIADTADLDLARVDDTVGDLPGEVSNDQDEPAIDGEQAVTPAETPESGGIVPLEADE